MLDTKTLRVVEKHIEKRIANHEEWFYHFAPGKQKKDITSYASLFPYIPNEEEIGKFCSQEYSPKKSKKQFNLVPTAAGAEKPTYLISLPHVLGKTEDEAKQKIQRIMNKFVDEAFYKNRRKNSSALKARVVILLGVNRMKSLDPALNRQFEQSVKAIRQNPSLPMRAFGKQWEPQWKKRPEISRPLYSPRGAFRLIKAVRPDIAQNVLKAVENANLFRSQVPAQDIRQWIKVHTETDQLIDTLKERGNLLYWATMDDDFQALRVNEGLFAIYDDLITANNQPDLLSAGYWVPDTSSDVIRLGVKLDMYVREAMAKHLPFAPYYPEPSFLFKIPNKWTFHRIKYTSRKGGLESRRFIESCRDANAIDPWKVVLAAREALRTSEPARMKTAINQRLTIRSIKDLGKAETLKALRNVNQSHISPSKWGHQICVGLPSGGNTQKKTSHLVKIFHLFDPIYLSKEIPWGNRYSFKKFEGVMRAYPNYYPLVYRLLTSEDRQEDLVNQCVDTFQGLTDMEKGNLKTALKTLVAQAKTAMVELRKMGLDDEWMTKVLDVSRDSGEAIWRGLNIF